VKTLLGRSTWSGLVTFMLVPVIVSVLSLMVWDVLLERGVDSRTALESALAGVLWVSIAVLQLTRRLRALSTVLERSGVLAQYLGEPTNPLFIDPRGTAPPAAQ
jgi:hypothetical protein